MTKTDSKRYAITSTDKWIIAYGAACGTVLTWYLSRDIIVSVLLGVPPAVFATVAVLLLHKRLGLRMKSPPHVTRRQRQAIFVAVFVTAVTSCIRAAWQGDGFELLVLLFVFVPGVCLFWFNIGSDFTPQAENHT